jgi:hypothetical protein
MLRWTRVRGKKVHVSLATILTAVAELSSCCHQNAPPPKNLLTPVFVLIGVASCFWHRCSRSTLPTPIQCCWLSLCTFLLATQIGCKLLGTTLRWSHQVQLSGSSHCNFQLLSRSVLRFLPLQLWGALRCSSQVPPFAALRCKHSLEVTVEML